MNDEYERLLAICERLLEWERAMGGWDAPVWHDLSAMLDRRRATTIADHGPAPTPEEREDRPR